MNKIGVLKNPIQEYAWGSKTALQALLGKARPGEKPMAEIWMGAHPKAPSEIFVDGKWESLNAFISRNPELILGKRVAEKFSNQLPFLFKVIAADRPLSIQVHPNLQQAQEGFVRENSLGIPRNSPNRNYKDSNHKPEILCAVSPFQLLKGFRNYRDILGFIEKVSSAALSDELDRLRKDPEDYGLKTFFTALMQMDKNRKELIVSEAVRRAERLANEDQAFHWMVELNKEYPGDIGVFSPVLLNFLQLEPGEAIYLSAGSLHTYLNGVGIELMANSDNVIRGGLTPKHIDVQELLKIVSFKSEPVETIGPVPGYSREKTYPTPAEEFLLSVIAVDSQSPFNSPQDSSIEILICIEGQADIRELDGGEPLHLNKGASIIVPAAVSHYRIEGNAKLYKASVPFLL